MHYFWISGINKPNENLPALKYGRIMETEAKLKYNEVMKKSVKTDVIIKECGLFVHLNMVYLGATPDCVVCDPSSSFEGLLEIKCPHSIADDIPSHHNLEYLEKFEQGSRLKYINIPTSIKFKPSLESQKKSGAISLFTPKQAISWNAFR